MICCEWTGEEESGREEKGEKKREEKEDSGREEPLRKEEWCSLCFEILTRAGVVASITIAYCVQGSLRIRDFSPILFESGTFPRFSSRFSPNQGFIQLPGQRLTPFFHSPVFFPFFLLLFFFFLSLFLPSSFFSLLPFSPFFLLFYSLNSTLNRKFTVG